MTEIASPSMNNDMAHTLASQQHTFPSAPLPSSVPSSIPVTLPSSIPSSHQASHDAMKGHSSSSTSAPGMQGSPSLQDRHKKPKPTPPRSVSGKGAIMTMPHLLAGEEITYTPTTHRISKAKKGKKVHNCTFPGCPKIFTRAEHRRRHEANHNAHPAFQCQIDGCKKPFQRADLLARHMERQHNMPFDTASTRSARSRGPMNDMPPNNMRMPHLSSHHSNPSHLHQAGSMSIGSLVDSNLHHSDYRTHSVPPNMPEHLSSNAMGSAPRSLRPEMLYGMSPSGDSLYASSDSCYSPSSDFLQAPQPMSHPYKFASDLVPQRPHSALDGVYNPSLEASPMSVGPPTPVNGPIWSTYDTGAMGFTPETHCMPQQQMQQHNANSPPWTGAQNVPFYDLAMPPQSGPWQFTKVNTF